MCHAYLELDGDCFNSRAGWEDSARIGEQVGEVQSRVHEVYVVPWQKTSPEERLGREQGDLQVEITRPTNTSQ